jgi:hypothetical protein
MLYVPEAHAEAGPLPVQKEPAGHMVHTLFKEYEPDGHVDEQLIAPSELDVPAEHGVNNPSPLQ